MFNAPSGALTLGHVGWAYQVGNSTWVYGATEDIDGNPSVAPGPALTTTSWDKEGDFNDVMYDFGQELVIDDTLYHPTNYYVQYRCMTVPSFSLIDAFNEFQYEATNGYDLEINNCLTKSIAIFQAYSDFLSDLPDGSDTSPNWYYSNALVGFGDSQLIDQE